MNQILRTLRIIHMALPVGIIMFAVVALTAGNAGEPDPNLSIIAIAVGISALSAGLLLPPLLLKKLKDSKSPELNAQTIVPVLRQYQTYKIIQWAVIEFGTFFCLAIFYITGDMATLGAAAAGLILLIISAPTNSQIKKYAEISTEEWQRLSAE